MKMYKTDTLAEGSLYLEIIQHLKRLIISLMDGILNQQVVIKSQQVQLSILQ